VYQAVVVAVRRKAVAIVAVAATMLMLPAKSVAAVAVESTTTAIKCGYSTYNAPTDWYFPPAEPAALIWLQHGFVEDKEDWSAFAPQLAARGYLVVATTLPTVNLYGCTVENLGNNTDFLNNIADIFATKDDPGSPLAASFARAAHKAGRPADALPVKEVFVGHSAGVEAIEYIADRLRTSYPSAFAELRGLISEDGVKSFIGSNTDDALKGLSTTELLIYATASPPSLCNNFQSGTKAIETYFAQRPFVGVEIRTGAHGDVFGPASPWYENLVCTIPQPRNYTAVWQLTTGWVTDMINGTLTPDYYPGGALYTALLKECIIATLP
jgi:hypothetical protein